MRQSFHRLEVGWVRPSEILERKYGKKNWRIHQVGKKSPPKERENPSDETALKKGQCGTIEKIGEGKKGTA